MITDIVSEKLGYMKIPESKLQALKILGLEEKHLEYIEDVITNVKNKEMSELKGIAYALQRTDFFPEERDNVEDIINIINNVPNCTTLKEFCDSLKAPMNQYRMIKKNSWKNLSPKKHLNDALLLLDEIVNRGVIEPKDLQLIIIKIYFAAHNLYVGREMNLEVAGDTVIISINRYNAGLREVAKQFGRVG